MQLVAIRHDVYQPPRSGSACVFRAGTSGFGDTGIWAAAMRADERHARMTAAHRAIILGHELPQTLARSLTVVTCDRPGIGASPLPRDVVEGEPSTLPS